MRPKITLNSRGVKALLNAPGVVKDLERRAESAASTARSSAPVKSGAYRDSIGVERAYTDRTVVRVVADVPYSHAVEARTGNLARSLDSAGGA